MSHVRFALFLVTVLVSFQLEGADSLQSLHPTKEQLTFEYTVNELEDLKYLPRPSTQITEENLATLIKEVNFLVATSNLSDMDKTILPPYLANAQKDFAWLSYLTTGELTGDLGPVTLWSLQLFIPDATLPSVQKDSFDVFSSGLASLVVCKASTRLEAERRQIKDYPIRKEAGKWTPTSPGYTGLKFGTAKTWYLSSSKEFLADAPPQNTELWKQQCMKVKNEQSNLDPVKTKAVYEWAGLTSIYAGNWEMIVTRYLQENQVPVIPQLYVRAELFSALADSNAAAFNSKYTYWVMRPSQRDPGVKPYVIIPNHPSYPSAHSTISSTAATVLTNFFPKDKEKWQQLEEEAGMSRIWGGIHYPTDHQAGLKLGSQVGQAVLERTQPIRTTTAN